MHIHSVDQTMAEWNQTAERDVSPYKRYLTNMEPFLDKQQQY